MIKLSQSISGLLKQTKFSPLFIGNLQNQWEKIVGSKIANVTDVIKIQNNTLYIKCKNPTWKNELQFQKNELLKKIQKETKKVKNIILI